MHPYIPHLLSDIRAAHRTETQGRRRPNSFEEEMEEIERWVSGEGWDRPFSDYSGLRKEDFPPAEQLSDEDIEKVVAAFHTMFETWNLSVDVPENLPIRKCYALMIPLLDEPFSPIETGFIHFDFCTGNAPDCVLGPHCRCLENWEIDADSSNDEY